MSEPELVKMSELARRSGVPAATIKHYLREGLLPEPVRTSRNMAYYDAALVPRIRDIKRLQKERFLPLKVIKQVFEEAEEADVSMAEALERVLIANQATETRTKAELVASGVPEAQLEWFRQTGVVRTREDEEGQEVYSGDDLALLKTLGAARRAGLTAEMLPYTILEPYMDAIRALVKVELSTFRKGVLPNAGDQLPELVEVANRLSEQLVVLLRRRLLLPTLEQLVREEMEED